MNWHCEYCGYVASVGLVVDLRPGVEASCPVCQAKMAVEDPHGTPELVFSGSESSADVTGTVPWVALPTAD